MANEHGIGQFESQNESEGDVVVCLSPKSWKKNLPGTADQKGESPVLVSDMAA